jgi:hypothetical protein
MSERTQALENAASRALFDFVLDPSAEKASSADNVIWRITEAVIAKISENLTSEMEAIRRVSGARSGETATSAIKRLASERDGMRKKYRRASQAWENEREKTALCLDVASELLEEMQEGVVNVAKNHSCKRGENKCARCRLLEALAELDAKDLE